MNCSACKALEDRLGRRSYKAVAEELRGYPSSDLLSLLDSKSSRIANTAASFLDTRRETEMVIDAILHDRVRTALGRVRALYILNVLGRAVPNAADAYVHCLNDPSSHVLRNALFGLVFLRRRDLIPRFRERLNAARSGTPRRRHLREAIEALEANDPMRFSPGFHDAENVWKLDEPA